MDKKQRYRETSVQEVEMTRLFEDRGLWRLFIHVRPADRQITIYHAYSEKGEKLMEY